jgi:type 1 glutamine amidotransferase
LEARATIEFISPPQPIRTVTRMKIQPLFALALFVTALSGLSAPAFAGAAAAPAPLRILLIAGGCCHDYANQKDILKKGLEERANVVVDIIYSASTTTRTEFAEYANPDWAKGYDLVIHDECSADVTDAKTILNITNAHAQGLPAVFLHCAMHSFRTEGWNTMGVTPWFEMTGLQTTAHGAQLPIALNFFDKENEITKGMANWTTVNEELYNNYAGGVLPTAKPLVYGKQGTDETVVVWTNIYKQKARVFSTTLGHNNQTVSDPRYLDLLTRGMLWATDKLNDTYLKPTPAAAAQKMSLMSAPPAAGEAVEVETQECGCKDADITLALAH